MSEEVTIRDIAKLAGVSYSTVSRALSGHYNVKPDTRKKVLDTAERLGYVANRQARSLAGGHNHVIGLVVHGLDNDYVGQLLKGIDEELARANLEIMLFTTHRFKNKEISYVSKMMRGLTDGLLIVSPEGYEAYLTTLQQEKFPYVLVDTSGKNDLGTTISATNVQGAYDAVNYLLELGHQRIGFITGTPTLSTAIDRHEGYKRALEDHNIPYNSKLIREGNFTESRGYEAALELLTSTLKPTAIFAASDATAFGVLGAAQALGVRVPQDLSVVGFDDLPISAYMNPTLTTVRQPLREMGVLAAQRLISHLQTGKPGGSIQLKTELITRGSCFPLAGGN